MQDFASVEDILDFAIGEEQAAFSFYRDLAAKVEASEMKMLFEEFAAEEQGHKAKLLDVKAGKELLAVEEQVTNLRISDYIVDVNSEEELDYQNALILAMKKEKTAFKMYTNLAETAPNDRVRNIFLALAQEEAKHKLRFELEYDELIMEEN